VALRLDDDSPCRQETTMNETADEMSKSGGYTVSEEANQPSRRRRIAIEADALPESGPVPTTLKYEPRR
jgi:hypothetical protein